MQNKLGADAAARAAGAIVDDDLLAKQTRGAVGSEPAQQVRGAARRTAARQA